MKHKNRLIVRSKEFSADDARFHIIKPRWMFRERAWNKRALVLGTVDPKHHGFWMEPLGCLVSETPTSAELFHCGHQPLC